MDWIDRARLLGLWERAVAEEPGTAFRMGPPCWMVADEAGGDRDIAGAAERVRARYFNADESPKMSNGEPPNVQLSNADVQREDEKVGLCWTCHKPVKRGTKCWACYKKVSRSKG